VPTYVYACRGCDERLEIVQKMSDDPLSECEKCGGSLRRVLFPPAVVYKGSGFYTTDYKNGGRKAAESTGGSGASDSSENGAAAKPETKTETKTEVKAETKTAGGSESKSAT
jgi:putative FmdB family regulatory protein